MLTFSVRMFAHRGLHGDRQTAPENSMEAFRRAIEAGWGIELDVQFSRDGQIVVFHDTSLQRICGVCGRVADYTYEELQAFPLCRSDQRIPLLSDVLAMTDGRVPLIIELKADGGGNIRDLCRDTALLLDSYSGEYAVESFHPMIVNWFRRNRPLVRRGQLSTDFFLTHSKGKHWQFFLLETMLTNLITRPDFIAYDIRHRNHPAFRIWRHFCTPVGWTLRDKETLDQTRHLFDYYIAERTISSD